MPSEWTYIISGIVFGLGAGLTPGPLMTLVMTETLKHGTREGVKVSMAPLITDFPIIVISIFLISEIANFNNIIGIISLAGRGISFIWDMKACLLKVWILMLNV
jgi:threonine/homoserine/homoserine lactone efflux protein